MANNKRTSIIRSPFALASFLACLLLLAACDVQQDKALHVWTRSSSDSRHTYMLIAEKFTQKTGIKVKFFFAATDFEQRLSRAVASNDLPDVIINDTSTLGMVTSIKIAEEIDRSKIIGNLDLFDYAWQGTRANNGKYYGVPISVHPYLLFIRKDWRTRLGLPLPQSWNDVAALAKAFTYQDPDGNGKADTYGFSFPGATTRGYASWFMSSYLWQAGGNFLETGIDGKFRPSLSSPAGVTTIKYFRKFICEDKSAQPGAINAISAEAFNAFRAGQTGILMSGPYHIWLLDKVPGKDKIELIPSPPGPSGSADVLGEGDMAYLMKNSHNKAAAKAFIEFMISPEGQIQGMNPGGFPVVRLPVNKQVSIDKVHNDPRWSQVLRVYETSAHRVPLVPNWSAIRQITAQGFNHLLAHCDSDIVSGLNEIDRKVGLELIKQKVAETTAAK